MRLRLIFMRPCERCGKAFRPTGRACWLCAGCIKKAYAWRYKKRKNYRRQV